MLKDKPELHTEQGNHRETICKETEMLPPRDISREADDKQNSIVLLEMMDTDKCIQRLVRTELEGILGDERERGSNELSMCAGIE